MTQEEKRIYRQLKCGIFEYVDVALELELLKKRERKLIKKLVLDQHVTRDGKPRKIKYIREKGLWYTLMPDKSKLYAKTEDGLYEKLLVAYHIATFDLTIKGVFDAALAEKEKTENNNLYTISHFNYDFQRFITQDFAETNIQNVSKVTLKAYTQEMVNRIHPKRKAFLGYKGLLNLIFSYAVEYDIIPTNPVPAIKNSVYMKSCEITESSPEKKILSESEIQLVKDTIRRNMTYKRYNGYFINGYAILFSIETGVRAAEIPALKWSDVTEEYIHIHAQQLNNIRKGGKEYYYAPWTKDEKGISRGGRKYPLTDALEALLGELRALQEDLGIESEYIFCHEDGEWIKTDAYETCLRRIMRSLDLPVTNNHAFRMSLNSNVFITRCNLPVTERARLLGHSVETNLRHYSFASKDGLEDVKTLLNQQVSSRSHLKVVKFEKKKSLKPA